MIPKLYVEGSIPFARSIFPQNSSDRVYRQPVNML
jgi:hypothetical protein